MVVLNRYSLITNDHVVIKRRNKKYLCKKTAEVDESVQIIENFGNGCSRLMGKGVIIYKGLHTFHRDELIYEVAINKRTFTVKDAYFIIKQL